MISFVLNVLWLIFGGFMAALGWFIAGVVMAITIVGLPWAFSAFRTAGYTLWPFGRTALDMADLDPSDWEAGAGGGLANVLWVMLAGWWLALGHLAAAFGLAITIIGVPFAWAHVKLARQVFAPVGRRVVSRYAY